MDLGATVDAYTRPPWLTAWGTAAGYGLILAVMTLLLFLVPFLVFLVL